MKCKQQTFDRLAARFAAVAQQHPQARNDARTLGASDRRFAWDIFWATERIHGAMLPSLYSEGLKDTTIETALLRAVKTAWPDAGRKD